MIFFLPSLVTNPSRPSGVNATPWGVPKSAEVSVFSTLRVIKSTTETVFSPVLATYAFDPFGETAISWGVLPTATVCSDFMDVVFTNEMLSPALFSTKTTFGSVAKVRALKSHTARKAFIGTSSTTFHLHQPANHSGLSRVAIPENAFAVDVETVGFGISRRQLDFGQHPPILRIELVNRTVVGIDYPERSVVPGDSVGTRRRAGRWNASDDVARLRLHQIDSSTCRHRHPVLAIDPFQTVPARRRVGRWIHSPVVPGAGGPPGLQRLPRLR